MELWVFLKVGIQKARLRGQLGREEHSNQVVELASLGGTGGDLGEIARDSGWGPDVGSCSLEVAPSGDINKSQTGVGNFLLGLGSSGKGMTGGAWEMQACEVMSESCCGGCHTLPCPALSPVCHRQDCPQYGTVSASPGPGVLPAPAFPSVPHSKLQDSVK